MAHEENMKNAMHADSVDVVFLGDSITEGWTGKSLGQPVKHKVSNIKVFNSLFHVDEGADFQGLPLGISGDKVSFRYFHFFVFWTKKYHLNSIIETLRFPLEDISSAVENSEWRAS